MSFMAKPEDVVPLQSFNEQAGAERTSGGEIV
jgi:hypothetical protein